MCYITAKSFMFKMAYERVLGTLDWTLVLLTTGMLLEVLKTTNR